MNGAGKMSRRSSGASQDEDRDSDAYRMKRDRNNLAVKKSREKMRQKCTETSLRMAILRAENDELQQKVNGLTTELSIMKELLLAHARGNRSTSNTSTAATTTVATTAPVATAAPAAARKVVQVTTAPSTTSKQVRVLNSNNGHGSIQVPVSSLGSNKTIIVSPQATVIPQLTVASHVSMAPVLAHVAMAPVGAQVSTASPLTSVYLQAVPSDHEYFVQMIPNKKLRIFPAAGMSVQEVDTKPIIIEGEDVSSVLPVIIQNSNSNQQFYSIISSGI